VPWALLFGGMTFKAITGLKLLRCCMIVACLLQQTPESRLILLEGQHSRSLCNWQSAIIQRPKSGKPSLICIAAGSCAQGWTFLGCWRAGSR